MTRLGVLKGICLHDQTRGTEGGFVYMTSLGVLKGALFT